MLTKDQFLVPLARLRDPESVVVTCMGVTRPWGRLSSSPLDFASADSAMGHTADLALGIAMAQPARRVICLNGDGSMLMSLGTLAIAVQAAAGNYVLFVVQNGTYEITGNQPVPAAGTIDLGAVARGVGFRRTYYFDDPVEYEQLLPEVLSAEGPILVAVRIEPGTEGPISRSGAEESVYLRPSTAEWSHSMRAALTAT